MQYKAAVERRKTIDKAQKRGEKTLLHGYLWQAQS